MNKGAESYSSFRKAHGATTFTDWLRHCSGDLWTNATEHRFTLDVANDSLPEEAFRRYLIQEYAFVDTSATVLGYTIAKAPSMREKLHLAQALMGLTTVQEDFFQAAFGSLGIPREEWRDPTLPRVVEGFKDFVVRTAATGGYEEPLTTMLGAEWMYLTWCTAASRQPASGPLLRDWVDLHVTPDFVEGVAWMREQLDTIGPELAPDRQRRLAHLFARTLDLEIAFHHVPYERP